MEKILLDYLADILFDGETIGGIQQRVFQDILANVDSFPIPDEIYEKLISHSQDLINDSIIFSNYFVTERHIKNLLSVVEEIYIKKGRLREDVLDKLQKNENVVQFHYRIICEFYQRINPDKIPYLLELTEKEVKKHIAVFRRFMFRFEGEATESTERTARHLIQLAIAYVDFLDDHQTAHKLCDDANEIVREGHCFDETIELAETYLRFWDGDAEKSKAKELYEKAYREAEFNDEILNVLTGMVINLKDLQRAKGLLEDVERKIQKSESEEMLRSYCILAEISHNSSGCLHSVQMASEYYLKAVKIAKTITDEGERKSAMEWIADSIEDTFGRPHIQEILKGQKRWEM